MDGIRNRNNCKTTISVETQEFHFVSPIEHINCQRIRTRDSASLKVTESLEQISRVPVKDNRAANPYALAENRMRIDKMASVDQSVANSSRDRYVDRRFVRGKWTR